MGNVIEIKDDCWQFKVKGKLINIAQATVDQEIEHQKKLQAIVDDGNDMRKLYEANVDYLVDLGADEEVIRGVSRMGFMQILETISEDAKGK